MENISSEYIIEDFIESKKLEKKATRDAYGDAMVVLGTENVQVVAINADLESSVRLATFTKKFPERSFQVGVAEANMASVATGLGLYGKIPFLSSFAAFSPTMNLSQIRLAAVSNANIKIASTHYGINVGEDGVSAQMCEDVSFVRSIPGILIVTPADYNQAYQAVFEVAKQRGPVYIRFTRSEFPVFFKKDAPFELGKGQVLRSGKDISIIATGTMVFSALEAALTLAKEGVDARVINIHTIKPIDKDIIIEAAKETNLILTVEEHQVKGGLGSAVAEVIVKEHPVRMDIMGIEDEFGESGTSDELYQAKKLTPSHIVERAQQLLS